MKYIFLGVAPIIFYFLIFSILTYPLMLSFSTHFFADKGDGLIHVWNLWWINKAITVLHQSPWWTSYLHYPHGVSLLGHTLNPFNGFMGLILLRFLTLVKTYNFIVVFSFVMGGLTAFWLSYYFTRSYWPSFIAGFIFTFSNYHFAHAEGHMNLVALEWIPLFLLSWYIFVRRPSIFKAIGCGIVLLMVFLCDYYYFLYNLLAGCIVVIWHSLHKRDIFFFLRKRYLILFLIFIFVVLLTTGPLIVSLLLLNMIDPLWGTQPPGEYSLDLLAPFIPGGHWRFANLTQTYWSRLPGNIHESSVYMGISVLFMLIYTWLRRKRLQMQDLGLWYLLLIFFFIISLGPALQIGGKQTSVKLPYALFGMVLPSLKLSSCPVRMIIMVILSASVISAAGFKMLFQSLKGRIFAVIVLIILAFEYLPRPMPASEIHIRQYIKLLRDLPQGYGIVDTTTDPTLALYFQTIHEKPMAFGEVSRVPKSVRIREAKLRQLIRKREYARIYCDYNIRYLVTCAGRETVGVEMIYNDGKIEVYDLKKE